ncbi:MAG: glycine zipper domain-containing protein [Verrucomicrobiota bacterium]
MKSLCIILVSGVLLCSGQLSYAQSSIFGQNGTGQPTNTILSLIAGAATGAAVGQAVGGEDGWWIGSLVGSAVGGAAGNAISSGQSTYYPSYKPHTSYRTRSNDCVSPRRISYATPVVIEEKIVFSQGPKTSAPYGHILAGGNIKSPWSEFTMSLGGKSPGQIVFDANTGQAFRIP